MTVITPPEATVETTRPELNEPSVKNCVLATVWMTVVGVTRDVKHYGVDERMRPGVYQPLVQRPRRGFVCARSGRGTC